jgi:hypothetical protein
MEQDISEYLISPTAPQAARVEADNRTVYTYSAQTQHSSYEPLILETRASLSSVGHQRHNDMAGCPTELHCICKFSLCLSKHHALKTSWGGGRAQPILN